MAERTGNLREDLIRAGIDEINVHGANGFSIRRIATACGVSSAAPYKHFKDKKQFMSAIIDYVNDQWAVEQDRVLSQCGDLTASAYKRKMGIKDYGTLIPGHGGIMDRFDSVLFTAPVVYYYIVLVLQ